MQIGSLADFTDDVLPELLAYADVLERRAVETAIIPDANTSAVNQDEFNRLVLLACARKRRRLEFFNSADGIALR